MHAEEAVEKNVQSPVLHFEDQCPAGHILGQKVERESQAGRPFGFAENTLGFSDWPLGGGPLGAFMVQWQCPDYTVGLGVFSKREPWSAHSER